MGTDVTPGVLRNNVGRTSGESQTFAKICARGDSPCPPALPPRPTPGIEGDEAPLRDVYDSIQHRACPSNVAMLGGCVEDCVRCPCVVRIESESSELDYVERWTNRNDRRNAREDRFRGFGFCGHEPCNNLRVRHNDKHHAQKKRLLPVSSKRHHDCFPVSECCCHDSHRGRMHFQNNTSGSESQTSIAYSVQESYSKPVRRNCGCMLGMVIILCISVCALSLGAFNFIRTNKLMCTVGDGDEWKCYSSLPELLLATKQVNKDQVEVQIATSDTLEKKIIEALPQSQLSLNKPSGTFKSKEHKGSGKGNVKWEPKQGSPFSGLYLKYDGEYIHVNLSGKYSVYFEIYHIETQSSIELYTTERSGTRKKLATARHLSQKTMSLQATVKLHSHDSLYLECTDKSLLNSNAIAYFSLFMI